MEFAANTWRPEASLFYRVDDKILTEAEALSNPVLISR
jgi:hypothetical protein